MSMKFKVIFLCGLAVTLYIDCSQKDTDRLKLDVSNVRRKEGGTASKRRDTADVPMTYDASRRLYDEKNRFLLGVNRRLKREARDPQTGKKLDTPQAEKGSAVQEWPGRTGCQNKVRSTAFAWVSESSGTPGTTNHEEYKPFDLRRANRTPERRRFAGRGRSHQGVTTALDPDAKDAQIYTAAPTRGDRPCVVRARSASPDARENVDRGKSHERMTRALGLKEGAGTEVTQALVYVASASSDHSGVNKRREPVALRSGGRRFAHSGDTWNSDRAGAALRGHFDEPKGCSVITVHEVE